MKQTAAGTYVCASVLIIVRLQSVFWAVISDCDETFNYWEPLHFLLHGKGFQTWEYSPEYALRSYTYLWMHGLPAIIVQAMGLSKPAGFYAVRGFLALICALLEVKFMQCLYRNYGQRVAYLWLFFQLISPGMFIASAALLPSSFSMYVTMAVMISWWNKKYKVAIGVTALSGLVGWPFSVLVSIPFVCDLLFRKKMLKLFCKCSIGFAIVLGVPGMAIDSYYFGKLTVASLNIIKYNVFTSHGPDLYGTESSTFYMKNLLLNYNVTFVLALLYPLTLLLANLSGNGKLKSYISSASQMAAFYLWTLVFNMQSHKEERFMFPVYPLISLGAAITLTIFMQSIEIVRIRFERLARLLLTWVPSLTISLSLVLSISRILAVYYNYSAPMSALAAIPSMHNTDSNVNVCYGKEWYRFPSSFFLPTAHHVRFVRSHFDGMLPAYYSGTGINATRTIHNYFNDRNQGNVHMLFDVAGCDYLIDLDDNSGATGGDLLEPNYSQDARRWTIVTGGKFLLATKSHALARAFYVPFLSHRHSVYGNFNLLRRIARSYR